MNTHANSVPRRFWKTLLVGLFALLMTSGLLVSVGAEAQAAPTGKVAVKTQRMTQATLKSKQVGWYNKGATLKLTCYLRGQSVTGYYSPWLPGGKSNIWYKVSDGYFVSDADIYTGTNNPITKPCPQPKVSLATKVDRFVAKYRNKYVDYDRRYGAQCVDLFNFYNRDVVGAPFVRATWAHNLYANAPTSKYQKLGPKATPRKGDVAVWSSRKPGSGGAGHVAIVLKNVSGTQIEVFGQNIKGSPSIVYKDSKSYLLGYLRPRT